MVVVEKTPAVVERAGALRTSWQTKNWQLRGPQVIIPGNAGILEEGRGALVERAHFQQGLVYRDVLCSIPSDRSSASNSFAPMGILSERILPSYSGCWSIEM